MWIVSFNFKPLISITSDFQKTVTIQVSRGSQSRTFVIHEDLLCRHSPYFNAAFHGKFEESRTRSLDYPDTDPTVFGIFVQWLYTQQVEGHSAKLLTELWVL